MPTFAHSRVIRAAAAPLFALMQDYSLRLEWDPFLSEARLVGAERAGLGVKSWCVDHRGRGMEAEYVSFRPPERVAVRMTKGPWMFRRFAGSWIYRALDEHRTEVTFKYHVESRPRLGWISDWVLKAVFSREMRLRLDALKMAVETTDLLARVNAS